MKRHKVGFLQDFFRRLEEQRAVLAFYLFAAANIVIHGAHIESADTVMYDPFPDASRADNAYRLPLELRAKQKHRRPALVSAFPHKTITFDDPRREREDKRKRVFRNTVGQYARRIGDRDTPACRFLHVYVIETDGVIGDDLRGGGRIEYGCVYGVREEGKNAVIGFRAKRGA